MKSIITPITLITPPIFYHDEPLINAQQASVALNLPLYYFVNTYKRDKLGVPFYAINRLVRYRLNELHKWQVALSAKEQRGTHA